MSGTTLPGVPQFYHDGEPHLSPGRITQYACEQQGITIEQLGVRPVVVGTFFPEIAALLAQQAGAEKSEHRLVGERDFYVADELSIITFQMGAPGTVMTAEELIACGAEKFIILGAAGSLQHDLPVASVVLPTTAIREEGTSHHYAPPELPASRRKDCLRRCGLRVSSRTWSRAKGCTGRRTPRCASTRRRSRCTERPACCRSTWKCRRCSC